MIAIVDYGVGNVRAFLNIFKEIHVGAFLAQNKQDLQKASKIILPGVGAFDWAMEKLDKSGMRDTLDDLVLDRKIPVVGVCVGMQMMANSSAEGKKPGLGWIPGTVEKFSNLDNSHPLPHMGWNTIQAQKKDDILRDIKNPQFYFLHSYYFSPADTDHILGKTYYDGAFPSIVNKEKIYGIQCHPEKSHHWGISLLKNFSKIGT